MYYLLALRSLSKSLNTLSVKRFGNFLEHHPNLLPATQNFATKFGITATNPTGANNDEWRIIYRMPMIGLASAFNRVKIKYGMFNAVIVPASFALEQYLQLPPSTAALVSAVGVTSWLTLAIISFLIRNLIGIIYINDNNDTLKLAYVDYWGKRNDVCIELDDLMPHSGKKLDFYQTLCLYSNDTVKYKLLQRFGRIEDLETFSAIFGE